MRTDGRGSTPLNVGERGRNDHGCTHDVVIKSGRKSGSVASEGRAGIWGKVRESEKQESWVRVRVRVRVA